MAENEGQITQLLKQWGDGDTGASERLMAEVYNELRRSAARYLRRERPGHTLQTTALINEAYLKLVDQNVDWQNRAQFFAIASQAMRRILVDHARTRSREKRGGAASDLPLDEAINIGTPERSVDVVALDEALSHLEKLDPRQAKVVELKYFSGLTNEEVAHALEVSSATVRSDWTMAKAWLYHQLKK